VTTFVDLSAPIEPSPPELPDAFYAELDYMARGTGVTADATRWLYEQGVRVMGIDAWVLDD
jgi:kynurenine formamidase